MIDYTWAFPKRPHVALLYLISGEFNCSVDEIRGGNREQHLVNARRVFCMLAKKHLGFTLKQIGAELNRHHATVLNALTRLEDLRHVKDPIEGSIKRIEEKLLTEIL